MRTRAIALAVFIFSGAALAQNPLGDDSGPNANDGQCDDSRFENIGAGNSNIVFWEAGRYDGRDATDCADLLLQGLIAWRRDTAVAEVPVVLEMETVAEAQQQESPTLPEGVTAESICTDNPGEQACWMELDNLPDCYVWNPAPQRPVEIDNWDGQCSSGLGTGVYRINGDEGTVELPYVTGMLHGTEVARWVDGTVMETPWVKGERHGMRIERQANSYVIETPFVNGEIHGTEIMRWADGTVTETPYVNGVLHGTVFTRHADGKVAQSPFVNGVMHGTRVWYLGEVRWEIPFVNGVTHGTRITRYGPDNVRAAEETPFVNGVAHGTQVTRYKDGRVWETVWVNDEIESQGCVAGCD